MFEGEICSITKQQYPWYMIKLFLLCKHWNLCTVGIKRRILIILTSKWFPSKERGLKKKLKTVYFCQYLIHLDNHYDVQSHFKMVILKIVYDHVCYWWKWFRFLTGFFWSFVSSYTIVYTMAFLFLLYYVGNVFTERWGFSPIFML